MLLSLTHKFIYIKTVKTGSTSVEMFFEPWCAEPGTEVAHKTPMKVSKAGVVGARGRDNRGRYKSHMPATEIAEKVTEDFGAAVWADSLKFCVVRNPFERAVSRYWAREVEAHRLADADFSEIRRRFKEAVLDGRAYAPSQEKHVIDGRSVADVFIRHRTMTDDLAALCARLELPFEPERLATMHARTVKRPEPASAYYDAETAAKVAAGEEWEIEAFGFTLDDAR